jgi:hypothetical protein
MTKPKYLKEISDKVLEKSIKEAFSFAVLPNANIVATGVAVHFNSLKPKDKKILIKDIIKEIRALDEAMEANPERNNLIFLYAYTYMALTMNVTLCLSDESWVKLLSAGQDFMTGFLLDVLKKEENPTGAWTNDKRGYG